MATVSIVKSEKIDVKKALAFINFRPKECELMVIKPNFCAPMPSSTGATTDLGILKQLFKMYEGLAKEIVVVESNGYNTLAKENFEMTGAKELCDYYGVKFVNLSRDTLIPVETDYGSPGGFKVPRTIIKADVFINAPVMKTHKVTTVSLALKNMLGIVPGRKGIYHPKISRTISDLMRIRAPDVNIMDGIIAMEGSGPVNGLPKKMGLTMASTDAVALDTVCCKVMGVNPINVGHITEAGYNGHGEYSINRIRVVGQTIDSVRDRFDLP